MTDLPQCVSIETIWRLNMAVKWAAYAVLQFLLSFDIDQVMEDIKTSVDGREGKDDERRLDIEEAPPELLAGVGEVLWKVG